MKDIAFSIRYLELTAELAKKANQKELYQKVIRILKISRELDEDLIKLNESIEIQNLHHAPEYQEWNRLETELVRRSL